MKETKHLRFEVSPTPKGWATGAWIVCNKHDGDPLGTIKWYGAWRQYCYFPVDAELVFSAGCLRDIAEFCATETEQRRQHAAIAGRVSA